ncbi:hypothetical protein [Shimia biformata]|uniref:hypothetical protein n=1 Tax=Shimia biformata TaxID=1294299 RepID=UPI00194E9493|nr:hypothetical protein [Shimia biformata]
MFLELIGTFIAGVAAGGLMMLLNRGLGGRLPRWLIPVAAGAAMLVATISSEYGWFTRNKNSLPEGFAIAQTVENTAIYRPWTYVSPFVDRFVAVDIGTMQTHDAQPDLRLANTYYFGRWQQVAQVPVVANCAAGTRAVLTEGVTFGEDGSVAGATFVAAGSDDPIISTMCRG